MEMTGPVNQPSDKSTPQRNSAGNNNKKKKVNGLMKCKCCVSTGKQSINDGDTASNLCGKKKREREKKHIIYAVKAQAAKQIMNLTLRATLLWE